MDIQGEFYQRTTDTIWKKGKLYDKIQHTFQFDKSHNLVNNDGGVVMEVVYLYSFDELPPVFRRYVIYKAQVRAATQLVQNPQLVQMLQIQEQKAMTAVMEYECNQGDYTMMGWPDGTSYSSLRSIPCTSTMSNISQTVPNYVLGISEQPDQLKTQGQVRDLVNGVPDVTRMLGKRPGAEFIRENIGATAHNGHWFSIYRDDREQYMCRILPAASNGTVDVWRLVAGPLNRYPGTPGTTTTAYVNVTTFGTGYSPVDKQGIDSNLDKYDAKYNNVAVTGPGGTSGLTISCKVDDAGRMQAAYIHTLGTGWESGMTGTFTIDSKSSTITYFEGIAGEKCHVNYDTESVDPYYIPIGFSGQLTPKAVASNLDYLKGPALDPTNATQFKTLTVNDTTVIVNRTIPTEMDPTTEPVYEKEGFVLVEQLAFGQVYQYNITQGSTKYEVVTAPTDNTSATIEFVLDELQKKTGEQGFLAQKIGNGIYIQPAATNLGTGVTNPEKTSSNYTKDEIFNISVGSNSLEVQVFVDSDGKVAENSVIVTKARTSSSIGDTETILGSQLGGTDGADNLTLTISAVGTGDANFALETPERQLLSVFTDEVQDITVLPDQCKNGYRCKVSNSGALEDDYYVKFEGADGKDGQGTWVEWRAGGTTYKIDNSTMPHVMVRMTDLSFLVSAGNYAERKVGGVPPETGEQEVGLPSFINNPINNVCLFRNRLGFLSRQDIILSRAGVFTNFWPVTALAITPRDPIDIRASSSQPATLYDSIEVNAGLLLFSKSEQFMLTTDNDILAPNTAKINFVSAYNYNQNVSPFTLGTTIGFLNDESSSSRLYEMAAPA